MLKKKIYLCRSAIWKADKLRSLAVEPDLSRGAVRKLDHRVVWVHVKDRHSAVRVRDCLYHSLARIAANLV